MKISYSRRLTNGQPLICISCQKQDRETLKNQLKEEEQQRHQYFERMQEDAFTKARAAMQEELKVQEEPETKRHEECVAEERELNFKAKAEAESFINKEKCKYENLSMEQAYLVYKFVFISEELMVKGLMGMSKEILN